ncbi:MAG TPA: ribonuclease HII [Candidatus Saccharimonadales bacterium]|nr:ribonuclease HII [Candidatus Saccharimonadales bacterium]
MIVGIDEVGRGAWAGPLVVGAVILNGVEVAGLTDSKLLTKTQRAILDKEIRQKAKAIGLGWVSAKHIDTIGLGPALRVAAERALIHLSRHAYKEIIIDGTIKLIDDPRVKTLKKADLLIPSVSAASIIAKVARDNYMAHIERVFPGYGFKRHVGYGTKAHQKAIDKFGASPIHRLSYSPLQKYSEPVINEPLKPTTKQIGDLAENEVALMLEQQGHEIIARNWRTKYCEIDIISRRDSTLYFTEVKYRKTNRQGGGIAAITPKKYQQMTFAAEFYAAKHVTSQCDLRLAVADVTGEPPLVKTFLELS